MRKWIYLTLIFITVILVFIFYLYNYGGGKYYLKAKKYVGRNSVLVDNLYGRSSNHVYGGILAGVWFGRVGIWGREGIKFFINDPEADFNLVRGCHGDYNERGLVFGEFPDVYSWSKKVKSGDYVVLSYLDSDNSVYSKLWGADYWVFLGGKLIDQCNAK